MANNKVTKLGPKAATPIETDLDGWKKIEGNPTMRTWIEYTADDGSSISGWWGATPGTYRATYAAPEFVHMIEGEIVITPDGGKPVTVRATMGPLSPPLELFCTVGAASAVRGS
jgi:uncharacterized protein